jgi:Zn finger protein HypA/HybF involved in hydrogenase expression
MSETRYCNICKQELELENHSHICRSCNNIIMNIEAKIDKL